MLLLLKNPGRFGEATLAGSAEVDRSMEEALDATSDLSDRLPVRAATRRRMGEPLSDCDAGDGGGRERGGGLD